MKNCESDSQCPRAIKITHAANRYSAACGTNNVGIFRVEIASLAPSYPAFVSEPSVYCITQQTFTHTLLYSFRISLNSNHYFSFSLNRVIRSELCAAVLYMSNAPRSGDGRGGRGGFRGDHGGFRGPRGGRGGGNIRGGSGGAGQQSIQIFS